MHGLNSAGSSHKAQVFRENLPHIEVLSPTYPAQSPDEAAARLSEFMGETLQCISAKEPLLIVGSSMGGFYGVWIAERFEVDHLVMINPALRPWNLLPEVKGPQYNAARDLHYELTEAMIEATRSYHLEPGQGRIPTTLLLDEGDELIDSRRTAQAYRDHGSIHLFPGGSHQFDHMEEALEIIAAIHAACKDGKTKGLPEPIIHSDRKP